ncbi:hypothetical protein SAMD00019534_073420, partial [Acytostelium subglobosum LB1]|uniref:hypothetical protein n=1 Tax=Acytostelium subglobosum LB1 TaxID=1410327 RepID=UPI0006451531
TMRSFTIITLLLALMLSASFVYARIRSSTVIGEMTFYAAGDNCPPSGEIAYPLPSRPQAGGVGTYANPITFAASKDAFPVHSIVYVPAYSKYFIMMDDCAECDDDWKHHHEYHIDCWIGSDSIQRGTTDCEVALTLNETKIIVNPPNNLEVDQSPFFNNDGDCLVPAQNCTNVGNECGNSCDLDYSITCQNAANLFLLSLNRFEELNPNLNCNNIIPSGTDMCQAGSCGGP